MSSIKGRYKTFTKQPSISEWIDFWHQAKLLKTPWVLSVLLTVLKAITQREKTNYYLEERRQYNLIPLNFSDYELELTSLEKVKETLASKTTPETALLLKLIETYKSHHLRPAAKLEQLAKEIKQQTPLEARLTLLKTMATANEY